MLDSDNRIKKGREQVRVIRVNGLVMAPLVLNMVCLCICWSMTQYT